MISDRGLQFAAELTKKLNKMLGIEMKFIYKLMIKQKE